MAALRGLLAATVLVRTVVDHTAAITRERWRRAHQTTAMISHYRRRGDPLPAYLRI
jgi:acyl-CoA synthetase (NDP forming)